MQAADRDAAAEADGGKRNAGCAVISPGNIRARADQHQSVKLEWF
jgi:hypothetical protein